MFSDENNTFLMFSYKNGMVSVNEKYLETISKEVVDKAKDMFEVLNLNNYPTSKEVARDIRCKKRLEVRGVAQECLVDWLASKKSSDPDSKGRMMRSIARNAKANGFFSVWMEVFKDEEEIKVALIDTYKGTAIDCFDIQGNPLPRALGSI